MQPSCCQIKNTMALPVEASRAYRCKSVSEAITLLSAWPEEERPLCIGHASNLILPSHLSQPLLLLESEELVFDESIEKGTTEVVAEAGVSWDVLVSRCVSEGLRGIENLSLIPGTVGAAPVQNIGAYGVELKDVLRYVEAWDFDQQSLVKLSCDDCAFAYRDSVFKRQPRRFVILRVCLQLSKNAPFKLNYGELKPLANNTELAVQDVRERVIAVRKAKLPDPNVLPNTGSFFKNPIVDVAKFEALKHAFPDIVAYPQEGQLFKLAAGWLIDQAGWKGKCLGSVGVHANQALVLVNSGQGSQEDIIHLANVIRQDIAERYGVELEIEPVIIY